MDQSHWREIWKKNFRDWELLANFLNLDMDKRASLLIDPSFPLNLPCRLAEKIEKNSLSDPLLKQFLPTLSEKETKPGFCSQPVHDFAFTKTERLLQKYTGRVLLMPTSACAMHCRYCFRQNFDYLKASSDLSEELSLIASDNSLIEVILSGGDPLSLSDERLGSLVEKLSAIDHLKLLRIHTRFPIGIPERITEELCKILEKTPLEVYFTIHANHPRELDDDVLAHLKKLKQPGINLLNQSVLLRGVNDNVDTLSELSLKLCQNGIRPYYLHQLDRVNGSHHFEVSEERGLQLIEMMRKRLPGYAVPTYVREIPAEASKTPLSIKGDLLHTTSQSNASQE